MTCNCKKPKYHHSRRQFLNLLGMGSLVAFSPDPLGILARGLTDGMIAKAQAQSAGANPRNYLVLVQSGAPIHWLFAGFLRPSQSDSFISNPRINNFFTNDVYNESADPTTNLEYRNYFYTYAPGQQIGLPILWSATIPTVSQGDVPMTSILNNIGLCRLDYEVDVGHVDGPALNTLVSDAAPSLTGQVADASGRNIPAVGLNYAGQKGYKSAAGTSLAYIPSSSNVMNSIIEPFTVTDPNVNNAAAQRAQMQSVVNQAMTELSNYANSTRFGADVLYKDRNNAESLFAQNLQSLVTEYNAAIAKYQQLAVACAQPYPGIIPTQGLPAWSPSINARTDGAATMAAAEVLFKHGFSSVVSGGMGGTWSVYNIFNYNDEHQQPSFYRGLLPHIHQFRCIAAWMYEFRRALGPALFQETLMHVGAEYGRKARPDLSGGGTDHASDAGAVAFFSGAIEEPFFLGNAKVGSPAGGYPGTYGAAAPTLTQDGSMIITKKHIGAGVADVLRVARVTSDKPAFSLENDKVVSYCEFPKNIA